MTILKAAFIPGCMVGVEIIESKTPKFNTMGIVFDLFIVRLIFQRVTYVG